MRLIDADSIATALAASFFYLVHYPATLIKLNTKISSFSGFLRTLCLGLSLSSCRYPTAVLDEAMRLSPSKGGLMPREVIPGGLEIEGYHNHAYYPEPFTFNPSRWIEASDTTHASV